MFIRVHSWLKLFWSPQFIQNRREKLKYGFQEKEFQPRMNTNIHEFWRWNWESEKIIKLRNRIRVHSCSFVAETLFGATLLERRENAESFGHTCPALTSSRLRARVARNSLASL